VYALWCLLVAGGVSVLALLVLQWAMFHGVQISLSLTGFGQLTGDEPSIADRVVAWWIAVLGVLSWAFGLSLAHTAGSLVYLVLREACDGQDWHDIGEDPTDSLSPVQ
ncbi:MAG: hypothetical protein AAGK04_05640, partial [Planctomycetota bacterium]